MKILIFGQNQKGGTDYVLQSATTWLSNAGHFVHFAGLKKEIPQISFDLLIVPTSRLKDVPFILHALCKPRTTKILIWAMGSRAVHGAYYNQTKGFKDGLLKNILDFIAAKTMSGLLRSRSLIFTDEVGMHSDLINIKTITIDYNDLIFPIPIKEQNIFSTRPRNKKPQVIAWIGRIDDDFKILPLLQLIDDVEDAINKNILPTNITFLIIGSGNAVDKLQVRTINTTCLSFETYEWIPIDSLTTTLIDRVDILFAMGSSVILGASLGVPSVIVHPYGSISERKDENYRWIHETNGHSLGEFPTAICKPAQSNKRFSQLFENYDLEAESKKSILFSKKFEENHVFQRLNKRANPDIITPTTWVWIYLLIPINIIKETIKKISLFRQKK